MYLKVDEQKREMALAVLFSKENEGREDLWRGTRTKIRESLGKSIYKKCYLRDKNQENPGQVQKDGLAFQ